MEKMILVADDSIPMHALVKAQLGCDGLKFHSVYDGTTAMSSAVALKPDLILLDVDMPRSDGFQTCIRLKSNPLTAAIPLIFLSADSVLSDKVKGLNLGAVDYIVKPFKPEELKARVAAALRTIPISEAPGMADGLSGLWNSSYFEVQLKTQLAIAKRSGRPLSCIVVDIDQWKVINSRQGKGTGSEILRSVARAMLLRCRTEDTLCRLEDGRLVILSAETDRFAAAKMVERLAADLQTEVVSPEGTSVRVTYSFGIADTQISAGNSVFTRAASTARRAIKAGGDRISVARDSRADERKPA
jgi:diguanylate cyclase (GGDEF)-like protein